MDNVHGHGCKTQIGYWPGMNMRPRFAGLHWTYPRDKQRALDLALCDPSFHPELTRAASLDLGYVLLPRTRSNPNLRAFQRVKSCPELALLRSV